MKAAGPQRGSTVRSVAAGVCLVAALVALLGGGLQMVTALERGGYGTSAIDQALVWLTVGGGLLAFGVALLIWEFSVRYNVRH